MTSIKHIIQHYDYSINLANPVAGTAHDSFALITLFSNGKNVAEFNFVNEGAELKRNYLVGEQLNLDLSVDKLPHIVDLLRHEKNLRLIIEFQGTKEEPVNLQSRLDSITLDRVGE